MGEVCWGVGRGEGMTLGSEERCGGEGTEVWGNVGGGVEKYVGVWEVCWDVGKHGEIWGEVCLGCGKCVGVGGSKEKFG